MYSKSEFKNLLDRIVAKLKSLGKKKTGKNYSEKLGDHINRMNPTVIDMIQSGVVKWCKADLMEIKLKDFETPISVPFSPLLDPRGHHFCFVRSLENKDLGVLIAFPTSDHPEHAVWGMAGGWYSWPSYQGTCYFLSKEGWIAGLPRFVRYRFEDIEKF